MEGPAAKQTPEVPTVHDSTGFEYTLTEGDFLNPAGKQITLSEYHSKYRITVDSIQQLREPVTVYKKVLFFIDPSEDGLVAKSPQQHSGKFSEITGPMREFGIARLTVPKGALVYCGISSLHPKYGEITNWQELRSVASDDPDTVIKYRCNIARVESLTDYYGNKYQTAKSIYGESGATLRPCNLTYEVGKYVVPSTPIGGKAWGCCGSGIHFVETIDSAWLM